MLVMMPDGQSLCTAREDAEWKAAVAAAEGGQDAQKEAGQAVAAAAAAAAADSPSRLRWWERLPAGLGSPARQQQQQQQQMGQPVVVAAAPEGAVGIELAQAMPAPQPQLPSRSRSRSRASSRSVAAPGEQGAGEGLARPGSALSEGSSRSESGQAHQPLPPQQQQQVILPPFRLRPSSWRNGSEASDVAAPQQQQQQRMTRASTGQQLALQQAGLAPLAPRHSLGPRPRRPVPIFDIEVPWEGLGGPGTGSGPVPAGSGSSGGGMAELSEAGLPHASAASGGSELAGAANGSVPSRPNTSLV